MTIISCGNCGVLTDTDRIPKPDMDDGEGGIDNDKAAQIDHKFKPIIQCPVCSKRMLFENGDSIN